jgi:hypothetical protein
MKGEASATPKSSPCLHACSFYELYKRGGVWNLVKFYSSELTSDVGDM